MMYRGDDNVYRFLG